MAWGTAGKFLLEKIRLIKKKAVRIISSAKYTAHTSEIFKKLHILKLDDLFKAQTASFMWDFDHGTLPEAFIVHVKNNESDCKKGKNATLHIDFLKIYFSMLQYIFSQLFLLIRLGK